MLRVGEIKTPLAKQVIRMRIRRREQTFYPDAVVDLPGKALKLASVHFLAHKLIQASSETRLLSGTGRNGDDHLARIFLNLVSYEDAPGEISLGFHKPLEAFFLDLEAGQQILGSHAGYTCPDLFIDALCGCLIKTLRHIDEPKCVHHTIVPKKKFDVFAEPGIVHVLENVQVHGCLPSSHLAPLSERETLYLLSASKDRLTLLNFTPIPRAPPQAIFPVILMGSS